MLNGSTFCNACCTSMEFVQILFMTFATAVYDTCPIIEKWENHCIVKSNACTSGYYLAGSP